MGLQWDRFGVCFYHLHVSLAVNARRLQGVQGSSNRKNAPPSVCTPERSGVLGDRVFLSFLTIVVAGWRCARWQTSDMCTALLSPQRVFVYGFSAELPTSVYTLELLVLRGPALLQHQLLVFCRVSLPFADELPPSPYVYLTISLASRFAELQPFGRLSTWICLP